MLDNGRKKPDQPQKKLMNMNMTGNWAGAGSDVAQACIACFSDAVVLKAASQDS